MLQEFAVGMTYFASLPESEKAGTIVFEQRQYQQNQQVMFSWLIGGGVILALLIAFFAENGSKEDETKKTSLLAPIQTSRLA